MADPTDDRSRTVSRLLREAEHGGRLSADQLLPLVYDELRALAAARLAGEPPGRTLDATALVHEAYLRLVGPADPGWKGRGHFFGAAALAMRRILVDRARARARHKRGGDRRRIDLSHAAPAAEEATDETLIAVDEAVRRLERQDPRKGQLVNLRFFAGLTNEQAAHALGVSVGTVERDWRFIRSWLQVELEGE